MARSPHQERPPIEDSGTCASEGMDTAAWLATALAGVALIQGVAGGPFWKDAGELSVSALDMGVAHPTGFSSWAALSRVFSLLPLGTNHLRLGLASAVPLAICIGLISHFLQPPSEARPRRAFDLLIRGVALPGLLLSSPTIWYLGTTPEVYALAALMALLWLQIFSSGTIQKTQLAKGSVLLGIVPSVHITALFGALCLCSRAAIKRCAALLKEPRWGLVVAALFSLAFSGVTALSVAAARNAEINFDNPHSPSALWRHLTAQGIQQRFAGAGARPGLPETLDLHAVFLREDIGLLALALALAGAVLWRALPLVRGLSLIVVADMAYNIWVNPMGRRDLQTGALTVLGVWALAFFGARALAGLRPRFTQALWATTVLVLIISRIGPLVGDLDKFAVRSDPIPLELMRASLAPIAPESLIFTTSDDVISLMLSARRIEGRRPDIRQVFSSFAFWPWHLKKQGLTVADGAIDHSTDEAQLKHLKTILTEEAPHRMILWEPGANVLDSVVGTWLQPGLLFGVVQRSSLSPRRWSELQDQARSLLSSPRAPVHSWSRRVLSESLRLNAVNAARKQDPVRAMIWSKAAVELDPDNGRAWNNLGVFLMKAEENSAALEAMTKAADMRPYDSLMWRNLSLAFLQNQRFEQARAALNNATRTAQTDWDHQRAEELLDGLPER